MTAVELSRRERGVIEVIRYNDRNPTRYVIRRRVRVGAVEFGIEWRRRSNPWGRFGGGWNWAIGVTWSTRTVLIRLLVLTLSVRRPEVSHD